MCSRNHWRGVTYAPRRKETADLHRQDCTPNASIGLSAFFARDELFPLLPVTGGLYFIVGRCRSGIRLL